MKNRKKRNRRKMAERKIRKLIELRRSEVFGNDYLKSESIKSKHKQEA